MQLKMEQTKPSIVDGAICSGKLSVAKVKLETIQARLAEVRAEGQSSVSQAEIALLQALAGPEELVKPGSVLNNRLQQSSNSNAMFDATMRAVSERKSVKMDEMNVENVKLEATHRKASIEKLKAESGRDAMKGAVADMADLVVNLVGMLGRRKVLVGDSANALNAPSSPEDDSSANVRKIAASLEKIKNTNDATFKALLGHSVESYIVQETAGSSIFNNFQMDGATFNQQIGSGPRFSSRGPSPPAGGALRHMAPFCFCVASSSYNAEKITSIKPRTVPQSTRREEAESCQECSMARRNWPGDASDRSLMPSGVSLQVTPASPVPEDSQ